MNGTIKMYNENRGFGFITGEDQNDYFFHISNVKGAEPLFRGYSVEFFPYENERGRVAKNVALRQPASGRSSFICFGEKRIKIGNIRNYGLRNGTHYYAKVFKWHSPRIFVDSLRDILFDDCGYYDTGERIDLGVDFEGLNFKTLDPFYKPYIFYFYEDGKIKKRKDVPNRIIGNPFPIIVEESEKYLYIETYQGDKEIFYQSLVPFDIFEKAKELDSYLLK